MYMCTCIYDTYIYIYVHTFIFKWDSAGILAQNPSAFGTFFNKIPGEVQRLRRSLGVLGAVLMGVLRVVTFGLIKG